MRKRAIYCLGAYILMMQMFWVNVLSCTASGLGAGAEALPAITSVSVSPGTTVVSRNSSYAFVASVSGANNYSREVAWSVHGQTSSNTFIDENGILHVGSDEASPSLIVKAISKQDSNYSATALATVQTSNFSIQVKASPDNGGTVAGGGTVKEGGYTVLSAVPNNGFTFDGWMLNNNRVSQNSQYVVEDIRSDSVYVAEFKPVNCQINVSVNDSNAGTVTESKTVGYGESVTLEAAARDGYRFDGWTENGTTVSTDTRLQLNNITQSRNLTAMFSQVRFELSVTCWPAGAGTISGQGKYDKGSTVKMKAVPIDGYRFVNWSEGGNILSTDLEYAVNNISRNMSFLATFERARNYSVTAEVSSFGGTVVPEGKTAVSEGKGISYVIIPEDGFIINAVYIDGKSVGAVSSYSFSDVKTDHTISADFVAVPGQSGNADRAENKADGAGDASGVDEAVEDAQKEEAEKLTGTLKYLNISVQEAERMIDEGDDMELLAGALETGDLQVTVRNDFAAQGSEIASVMNYEVLLEELLTGEEKLEMVQGNLPITLDLRIQASDREEVQQMAESFEENKLPGMTIGQYFVMTLVKTGQGDAQVISDLAEELRVVINVPEELKKDERKFYILRLHTNEDGIQDFAQLLDEDDDSATITFSTDKISTCAIAYIDWSSANMEEAEPAEDIDNEEGMINVIVCMAVVLAVVITFWLLWHFVIRRRH